MSEYIHLVGAEDVQRAGITMSQAADDMQRAASSIDFAVERLLQGLNEFACRMEALKEVE